MWVEIGDDFEYIEELDHSDVFLSKVLYVGDRDKIIITEYDRENIMNGGDLLAYLHRIHEWVLHEGVWQDNKNGFAKKTWNIR